MGPPGGNGLGKVVPGWTLTVSNLFNGNLWGNSWPSPPQIGTISGTKDRAVSKQTKISVLIEHKFLNLTFLHSLWAETNNNQDILLCYKVMRAKE